MRKLIAIIIIIVLLPIVALADLPDISNLSFDELVALREKIDLAMWECKEWQEVTVPVGVWEVGVDIPVGHWSITASLDSVYGWGVVEYCNKLD